MRKSAIFAPVELSTLKLNMVERLTEAIFTGKIRPGERLNESQLAREMQVSRAPIREALQQLQEQGLVEDQPPAPRNVCGATWKTKMRRRSIASV